MKLIKWNSGAISTYAGETRDVIAQTNMPVGVADLVIAGAFIALGIFYLMGKSFINGAKAFAVAEDNAMIDLGLYQGPGLDIKKL